MSQKRKFEAEASEDEVQEKKAKEEPAETVCDKIVKLAKDLGDRKVAPTHFLVLDVSCAPDVDNRAIARAIVKRMNGALYEMKFSTDSISMTWHSACDSLIFWTVSRLAEPYIQQLTKRLVKKVATETQTALGLGPEDFTCLTMITKSTGVYTFDEVVPK